MPMPEVVIPSEFHLLHVDDVISSSGSNSSYKDTETISPTLMSPQSVLPESQAPPRVDLVNLVLEDEGEKLEEDKSFKEDTVMELEPVEEDSSKESY